MSCAPPRLLANTMSWSDSGFADCGSVPGALAFAAGGVCDTAADAGALVAAAVLVFFFLLSPPPTARTTATMIATTARALAAMSPILAPFEPLPPLPPPSGPPGAGVD